MTSETKKKAIKTEISDLKNVSPKNLLKLKEQNITSLEDLSEYSVINLKNLLDTTENKASLIIAEARKALPPFRCFSGLELKEMVKNQDYLKLPCSSLNDLLGGKGIKTGTVSELYGAFASGKSQIAFSSIISSIMPVEHGGLNGSVIFVDTEGTFDIDRIMEIASFYTHIMPMEDILKNIRLIRPVRSMDQIKIFKSFLENNSTGYYSYLKLEKPVRLVVIDSLTAHFRAEYLGRGALAERQQRLSEHLRDLHQFAQETNSCVLALNQVMGNPNPFSAGGDELPIGGHVLSHSTYCRIYLRKRRNYRLATLVDSACLPGGQALYKIGKKGVMNLEDSDTDSALEQDELGYPVDVAEQLQL